MLTRLPLRQIWSWWIARGLVRLAAAAVLLGAVAVGGVLALRALRPAAPAQVVPGQLLAQDLARALAAAEGVRLASGAYVPGDRLLLYTRLDEGDLSRVRSWAVVQIEPFAERLAALPARETLTWVIDYGAAPAEQEVLLAPLRRANDPATYRYISAAPGLLVEAPPEPTAAPAPPIAQPVPVPTAAPVATPLPAVTQAPTTSPPPTAAQAAETVLLSSDFGTAGSVSTWRPLAGEWALAEGVYAQRNPSGYDFISLLDLPPQTEYSVEARLRLVEGEMGGGIVYNAPSLTERNGAQLVDLDRRGSFLRWGYYDEQGAYRYVGGLDLDPTLGDGAWHTLRVVTRGATSSIFVNGRELAQIENVSRAGHVGLTTSQARVDFDDVTVRTLGAATLPAPAASPERVTSLSDNFEDGDAKGWQVLSGTWQTIEGAYHQSSDTGTDMSTVSLFQSERFTATVRMRLLSGQMGGGLLFNLAARDTKARSQVVNYTQGGKILQWGHFDEGGNFVFEGGAEVPGGADGDWHTLELRVADGRADVLLDGEEVVVGVRLTYTGGYVGLLSNNGSVAFDDVRLLEQTEN